MSTPSVRELHRTAPAPVRRQKSSLLRRHWLTGAFVFGLLGLGTYATMHVYNTEVKLQQAEQVRSEIELQLKEAQRQNRDLETGLTKVSDDSYLELAARTMGFIYPNETVYQKGSGKSK